ncbi:MAG: prepilin-type N-terminal cleavage/methylation domain-containing protein [Chitinivibrionales bacterium]|nr:prepilin-type N-terminal cleavage/methylation domain-containing protein [Chitinivibrionales bacterium]
MKQTGNGIENRFQEPGGYSLLEMVLAVAISSIIIMVAFSSMIASSKSFAASKSRTKVNSGVRDALKLMVREMENTGYKLYLKEEPAGSGIILKQIAPNVVLGNGASLRFGKGNPSDSIDVYMAKLNGDGTLHHVERIQYFLSNQKIYKNLWTCTTGAWSEPTSMILCENVEALQFQFSPDRMNWSNEMPAPQTIKAVKILALTKMNLGMTGTTFLDYPIGDIRIAPASSDRDTRLILEETVEIMNNGI